jgi:hypothetical protein
MLPQSIDGYLAQPGNTLAGLRKQAIAGKVEIVGCRCSWDGSGRDRKPVGLHLVIPVPALLYLRWERETDTDDIVLARSAFGGRQRASLLPGGITYVNGLVGARITGWADLAVQAKAAPPQQKRKAGRKEILDHAEIAAARELVAAGKNNWAAAQEVAGEQFPDKTQADPRRKLERRVYDKLRKGDLRKLTEI